jgi:hypothetical protein
MIRILCRRAKAAEWTGFGQSQCRLATAAAFGTLGIAAIYEMIHYIGVKNCMACPCGICNRGASKSVNYTETYKN